MTANAAKLNLSRLATVAIRVGYVARGFLYLLLAWLAGRSAIGWARHAGGAADAMHDVGRRTGGTAVIVLLAIGLLGMAAGMAVVAIRDWARPGLRLWQRAGMRIVVTFSGIGHLMLACIAGLLVLGVRDDRRREYAWAAKAVRAPVGRAGLVVGAIVAGIYGLVQVARAIVTDPRRNFELPEQSGAWAAAIGGLGRFGIAARGVVYVTLGVLLAAAAWWADAHDAVGIGGALDAMKDKPPFGTWMLGIVAGGLGAYAVLMFAYARYAKLGPRNPPKV